MSWRPPAVHKSCFENWYSEYTYHVSKNNKQIESKDVKNITEIKNSVDAAEERRGKIRAETSPM